MLASDNVSEADFDIAGLMPAREIKGKREEIGGLEDRERRVLWRLLEGEESFWERHREGP